MPTPFGRSSGEIYSIEISGMEVQQQGLRRRIQQAILARQKKVGPAYGPRPRDLLALLETIAFFSGGVVIKMPEPPERQ
jgi:hypothetical protein